jgi:hypothetical protein
LKILSAVSVANFLITYIGWWVGFFVDDEEAVTWLHVASSCLGCLEIITLMLLSMQKIDDCHTAYLKRELGQKLGA